MQAMVVLVVGLCKKNFILENGNENLPAYLFVLAAADA